MCGIKEMCDGVSVLLYERCFDELGKDQKELVANLVIDAKDYLLGVESLPELSPRAKMYIKLGREHS